MALQTLQHSPAEILQRALIREGVGVDPTGAAGSAWPIFASAEPDRPDQVIVTYDTAGKDEGRSMIDGELFGHFGVQVLVRAGTHRAGWKKADEVQTTLARGLIDDVVTIEGVAYLIHCAANVGDVLALGHGPDGKRSHFTVNALLDVRVK